MNTALCMREEERNDPEAEIQSWMYRRKIRRIDMARELGVGPSAITHFLQGDLTSARIRDFFIQKGCPEELLNDLAQTQRRAS